MPRLTSTQDGSNKFWEGVASGKELVTEWGAIGTKGQSKTDRFDSPGAAQAALAKKVKEKLGKGYVLESPGGGETQAAAAAVIEKPAAVKKAPLAGSGAVPLAGSGAVPPAYRSSPPAKSPSGRARGTELIAKVIAHVVKKGLVTDPAPLSIAQIDDLERSLGFALPPSLRAWLSFDSSWLRREYDWFKGDRTIPVGPMKHPVEGHSGPFYPLYQPLLEARFAGKAVALDAGSDSMRILYFGDPDDYGEYPVLFIDHDDCARIGVELPGFDVWLAQELEMWEGSAENLYTRDTKEISQRIFGKKSDVECTGEPVKKGTPAAPAPPPGSYSGVPLPAPPAPAKEKRLTDAQLEKALGEAAGAGRIDRFRVLLSDFTERRLPKDGLGSPLRAAAYADQSEILGLLLDAGANPNGEGNQGSALALVAGGDDEAHLSMAKRLFAAGALPHAPGSSDQAAFYAALEDGGPEMIKLFIQAGADPNLERPGLMKPLAFVAAKGPPQNIDALIDAGARVDVKKGEASPLHLAVDRGFGPSVERLVARGADGNARDKSGKLPLHLAFSMGRFDLCSLLLRGGARRDLPDENGFDFKAVFDDEGGDIRPVSVHYVPSVEPQQLTVSFSLIVQDPKHYVLSIGEGEIVQMINWGLGAGERFAPGSSTASVKTATAKLVDKSPKNAHRLDAAVIFEVSSVTPEFLRYIAARVLQPMKGGTAVTLRIEGSAPGLTAVDGPTLARWLADTTTYPKCHPGTLPFQWQEVTGSARVTVKTRELLTDGIRGQIDDAVTAWQAYLGRLPDEAGRAQEACFRSARPTGKAKQSFSIDLIQYDKYSEVAHNCFPYERTLARSGLKNALVALHSKHVQIEEVVLSLPAIDLTPR